MISIQGKELLVRSLDLPNVDAIYFTESEQELSDLIFVHRWCMVFPLSSSTIGKRLRELRITLNSIASNKQNPYRNDHNIQSGAALLSRNLSQVEACVKFLETTKDSDVKVLIPLKVFNNKVQGLFDWFNESVEVAYTWRSPNVYSIQAVNSLTKRSLYPVKVYVVDYDDAKEEPIRSAAFMSRNLPAGGIWSLGERINKSIAINSGCTVGESGDWLIDADKVDIYNNDLAGEIRSINPCSQCPNALKRTVGNCYFMTSQCRALVLPNSEDKTSWKTLKNK
jgi:hypothetical protein